MKKARILFCMMLVFAGAYAQKVPNVQRVGLRAPASIKIDGNLTEWGDKLQAYNAATELYYTLSNDDENLYLAIKVKEFYVIDNIIRHGLRFAINHSISKKDASPLIITYPVLTIADRGRISDLMASLSNEGAHKPVNNSVEAFNTLLKSKSKFIKIEGINDIADKAIPVYNERGITAVSAFEKPFAYVYELAIPLKYLSLSGSVPATFSYQIKINFPDPDEKLPPPPPPNVFMEQPLKVSVAVTDFWGEYILAK